MRRARGAAVVALAIAAGLGASFPARAQTMAVEVTATVGQCPGGTDITVVRGTDVAYCYVVFNPNDATTLTNVEVVDDQFGPAPVATIPSLAPGATETVTATRTFLSHDTISFVTVSATPRAQGVTLPRLVVHDQVSVYVQ